MNDKHDKEGKFAPKNSSIEEKLSKYGFSEPKKDTFDLTTEFGHAKSIDPYYKDYNIEELDLEKLADDNDLRNDVALGSYHEEEWGEDPTKFVFSREKMKGWGSNLPRVTIFPGGRMRINDGRHRMRALLNSGYKKVKIPVFRER